MDDVRDTSCRMVYGGRIADIGANDFSSIDPIRVVLVWDVAFDQAGNVLSG